MTGQLNRRALLALLGVSSAALTTTLARAQAQSAADTGILDVAVIGAGAAGLTAGFLLNRAGVSFQVFEAADRIGGRAKKDTSLADFPLDLGGEWIHTTNRVLNRLSKTRTAAARAIEWRPVTCDVVSEGEIYRDNQYALGWRGEHRFINTTWFDFFNDYMAQGIASQISVNTQVTSVDYSGDHCVLGFANGRTTRARHVIVTVPLSVLKAGDIRFNPGLPRSKTRAMAGAHMPDGLKLFLKFSKRFYPDMVVFDHEYDTDQSELLFYNVSLDKPTRQNILGFFAHGALATPYTRRSERDLLRVVLGELDALYGGAASDAYQGHVLQNWSASPFHRGTYSFFTKSTPATLGASIKGRVHFAGEAYNRRSDGEWGYMHIAARSAYDAVDAISRSG